MHQVENVLIPIEQLRATKLIDAPVGSVVYEDNGNVWLRADKGTGAGLPSEHFVINLSTWAVELLQRNDDPTRQGAMLEGLSFLCDPMSLKPTKPDNRTPGDLIVNGSRVMVIAKAPNGSPILLTLNSALSDVPPLTYSGWSIGLTTQQGEARMLFRQIDLESF